MARFVRFIVHQRVARQFRQIGLFTAACFLQAQGRLQHHDQLRLTSLLSWFRAELPVPPQGSIPSSTVFWYLNAGPFAQRMWELADLLREYDFTVELITSTFVGRVVYRDKHQVAAVARASREERRRIR